MGQREVLTAALRTQFMMVAVSGLELSELDESMKSTRNIQEAQPTCDELEGRKRTLTQKGFEYQLPFKKKI